VVRLLCKSEISTRFLHLALYQGVGKKKASQSYVNYPTRLLPRLTNILAKEMQSSSNPALQEATSDPLLFATAFKKNRFYMISTREPESSRDVFNEKPSREEQTIASVNPVKSLPTTATIRTTMGDIVLKLMPQFAPKSVENFIGLAKSGYYDGVVIHRVVKGFMIQTGDPNGNNYRFS
jgi:peptidylprolyl isomerase domain and WD repeat-containing protein 1